MKSYVQLSWIAIALSLSSCNKETPKYLGQSMEIYVDETASIGILDVPNQDFKKQSLDVPYWGYTTAAIWIKLTTPPDGDWIEINNIAIDQIEVYRDGSLESELYGDHFKFDQRPVRYRNFVIPINDTKSFIFRFSSTSSFKIPIRVWDSEDFVSYVGTEYAVRFIFFGLLFAIGIISFIFFLTTRLSYFCFHGLYVIFFGILHLSLDGLAYQFLWGDLPEIKKEIGIILLAATNSSYLMLNYYAVAVTRLKKLSVKILLGLWGIVCVITSILSYHQMLMISFSIVSFCTGCIAAIAWHSYKNKRTIITKFFLIINILNLIAYLVYIGKSIGFFGYDTFTEHITEFVYVIEFIVITIAITRYHEQLKVSYSRYKGISEVAGMIAHDVRKPFSRVVSFLDLIPQVVKDPRAQKFIQSLDIELRDDIQKIRTTLEEIIELNASKPLEMVPSYLPDVAHDSLIESITFTQSKGVKVKTKFVGHCTAMVDPHELKRVFSNLITNALEMMREDDILEIAVITYDSSIKTEVRNTGTSIDKNDLPKIFDFSFSKGKANGHGLGLAVVNKIITDHGSSIKVDSTSNSVTFSFSLPVADTSITPEGKLWPKLTSPHQNMSY